MDCHYRFQLNPPGRDLRLFIHQTHNDQPMLDAWFNGRRQPLTDRTLLKAALSIPFLTFKVVWGIHWEALKLWRKGLKIFRHPPTPKYGVSLIQK